MQILASQLPAVLVISGTLAIGVGLDVESCRAVGAIFAFLYVGTKLGELDWKRCVGMVCRGVAWRACGQLSLRGRDAGLGPGDARALLVVHVWGCGA